MTEPISADDGTQWIHGPEDNWTGWTPGEDGVWILSLDEMHQHYPEIVAQST